MSVRCVKWGRNGRARGMALGQAIPGDTLSAAATRNRAARLRLRFFADNSVSSTTTHSGEESRGKPEPMMN